MRSKALTFLTSALAAFALVVVGPAPSDSRVCGGAMRMVVCVPPEEMPPSPPSPPAAPQPPTT